MEGKDEEKPLAVMKSSVTKESLKRVYRPDYLFSISSLLLILILTIMGFFINHNGTLLIKLILIIVPLSAIILLLFYVYRIAFRDAASEYEIAFYPDFLMIRMPNIFILQLGLYEIKIKYQDIKDIESAEKNISGIRGYFIFHQPFYLSLSETYLYLYAIPPKNGFKIILNKPQEIPRPVYGMLNTNNIIIDIPDIDTFNKIVFKKETKLKPKRLLLECPKCNKEFRLERDMKEIICSNCGAKGMV
jgi:hypothetical protein